MKHKNELVTISFHYLRRVKDTEAVIPFSPLEFDRLFQQLQSQPQIDLSDEDSADRIRYRLQVPLENVVRIDQRTIFGVFKASYWGHSYENTARGHIPADSISLRPFHFLLYLSESGRIYIASQYLGQFGGYSGLRATISSFLSDAGDIQAVSFRTDGLDLATAKAKEVRITFSSKARSLIGRASLAQKGVIAFKKAGKDEGFEQEVASKILSTLGRPRSEIKGAIASLLNDSALIEASDDDIEDCTILAEVNGRRKTIYMLDRGSFASRIPIDVPLDTNGHPVYGPTRDAIIELLREAIIARRENA